MFFDNLSEMECWSQGVLGAKQSSEREKDAGPEAGAPTEAAVEIACSRAVGGGFW